MNRRQTLGALFGAGAIGAWPQSWAAASNELRLQYDWKFEGPAAIYLYPEARGFFKKAGLDVTIDAGSGAAATIGRVASGAYDLGVADMSALMEFVGNNPTAPRPVAVMMMQNNSQAAIAVLKKSGITKPSELSGRKIGAPVFDAARRTFPIFAKANQVQDVSWVSMDIALKETMLARGDVDALAGFGVAMLLNLEARGVPATDATLFEYRNFGARLYGNAIIASPKLIKERPEALRSFLAALSDGIDEAVKNPARAIDSVVARDGIVKPALEQRRLTMMVDSVMLSADARAEGFGRVSDPRMALLASQISDVFQTKSRIDPATVWDDRFLPPRAQLDRVFTGGRKG
ncbi:ABC transporter substrate-binding protein [soil metagenome]